MELSAAAAIHSLIKLQCFVLEITEKHFCMSNGVVNDVLLIIMYVDEEVEEHQMQVAVFFREFCL